jgi:N utilization substance protein B
MGTFEMVHRPDTPYRVIINEAIELAKGYGGTDGHRFVNGVLDKLAARLRPEEFEANQQQRRAARAAKQGGGDQPA